MSLLLALPSTLNYSDQDPNSGVPQFPHHWSVVVKLHYRLGFLPVQSAIYPKKMSLKFSNRLTLPGE